MEDKATKQELFLVAMTTILFICVVFSLMFSAIEFFFKMAIYQMKWYWIITIGAGAVWIVAFMVFYGRLATLMWVHWLKNKELEKRLLIFHNEKQLEKIKNGKLPVIEPKPPKPPKEPRKPDITIDENTTKYKLE